MATGSINSGSSYSPCSDKIYYNHELMQHERTHVPNGGNGDTLNKPMILEDGIKWNTN